MKKRRWLTLLLSVSSTSIILLGCRSHDEREAQNAFAQYVDAWKDDDLTKVWRLMSPRLKLGNDNSEAKFREFVAGQGMRLSGHSVHHIKVNAGTATITVDMQYATTTGVHLGSEKQVCKMIQHSNKWMFDDCKTGLR